MCVYVCMCMKVIRACASPADFRFLYPLDRMCVCMHMCVCVCVCLCVCMSVCLCVYVFMSMHVCLYVIVFYFFCICICMQVPIKEKIEIIATQIYGAKTVEYEEIAERRISMFEKQNFGGLPICMAKTHLRCA